MQKSGEPPLPLTSIGTSAFQNAVGKVTLIGDFPKLRIVNDNAFDKVGYGTGGIGAVTFNVVAPTLLRVGSFAFGRRQVCTACLLAPLLLPHADRRRVVRC